MLIAARFEKIARRIAANGDANGRVNVARSEAISRGARSIDVNLQRRLTERRKYREVGDSPHGGEHVFNSVRGVREFLEAIAIQLDRILAFHARYGFRDVVLKILREIEFDSRKIVLQLLEHLI